MGGCGPGAPLGNGLVGAPAASGVRAFGPTQAAARIEGDKAYAKELMRRARVPTAEARIFENFRAAHTYVATRENGLVVKASGLAAGKGVIVCDEPSEALIALERMMLERCFGDAANTVIVIASVTGFGAAGRRQRVYVAVGVVAGIASIAIGAMFLLGSESLLPDLTEILGGSVESLQP